MKKAMSLFLLFISAALVWAGNGMIEGYVTDKETGEPLPGANVVVRDTRCGAVSNIDGFYIVLNVPPGQYEVEVTYTGYGKILIKSVQVKENSTTKLDVEMTPQAMEGETAVVDGADAETSAAGVVRKNIRMNTSNSYTKDNSKDPSSSYSLRSGSSPLTGKSSSDDTIVKRKPGAEEETSSFFSLIKKRDGSEAPALRKTSQASGLRAGFADDNKQYNYFLNFLDEYGSETLHQRIDVSERLRFIIKDQAGKPLPNAAVRILQEDKVVRAGRTYADGSFNFFPNLNGSQAESFTLNVDYHGKTKSFRIERNGNRKQDLSLDITKNNYQQAPLDILFILDATGSMGEEIERLRATIDLIHLNLTSMGSEVQVRFGMVLYRDRDDDYLTKKIPLTTDIEQFRQELALVTADGGGDSPEDLQSALTVAMKKIDWNTDGIRMGFIITDAEPHLDYGQKYTYADAAREAKERGVRLHSIGTGGLAIGGEYVLRQISQFTSGRYIFLTYGEKGESDGGTIGSVSHHTGANYQTDKLEAIIIQFAKEDLGHFLDKEIESEADYFLARNVDFEKSEETLKSLFDQALSQLIDYSAIRLPEKTVLGLLPLNPDASCDAVNVEYLTEQVTLAVKQNSNFTLADRGNTDEIMKEWGLQLSGMTNDSVNVKVGELLNAETLLVGNLFSRENEYELFLKLVRVETGELLAVTRLRIDRQLCPSG